MHPRVPCPGPSFPPSSSTGLERLQALLHSNLVSGFTVGELQIKLISTIIRELRGPREAFGAEGSSWKKSSAHQTVLVVLPLCAGRGPAPPHPAATPLVLCSRPLLPVTSEAAGLPASTRPSPAPSEPTLVLGGSSPGLPRPPGEGRSPSRASRKVSSHPLPPHANPLHACVLPGHSSASSVSPTWSTAQVHPHRLLFTDPEQGRDLREAA